MKVSGNSVKNSFDTDPPLTKWIFLTKIYIMENQVIPKEDKKTPLLTDQTDNTGRQKFFVCSIYEWSFTSLKLIIVLPHTET